MPLPPSISRSLALLALAAGCSSSARSEPKPVECRGAALTRIKPAARSSADAPDVRRTAQLGLDYLTSSAQRWTEEHKCFGCHVQAVAMEALAVGTHHQYSVPAKDV